MKDEKYVPVNFFCPFYWEDKYCVAFCKLWEVFLAQSIACAISLPICGSFWIFKYCICSPRSAQNPRYFISTCSAKKGPKWGILRDESVIPNSKSKQRPGVKKKTPEVVIHYEYIQDGKKFWFLHFEYFSCTKILLWHNFWCIFRLSCTLHSQGSGNYIKNIAQRGLLDNIIIFTVFFKLWIRSHLLSEWLIIKCPLFILISPLKFL